MITTILSWLLPVMVGMLWGRWYYVNRRGRGTYYRLLGEGLDIRVRTGEEPMLRASLWGDRIEGELKCISVEVWDSEPTLVGPTPINVQQRSWLQCIENIRLKHIFNGLVPGMIIATISGKQGTLGQRLDTLLINIDRMTNGSNVEGGYHLASGGREHTTNNRGLPAPIPHKVQQQ